MKKLIFVLMLAIAGCTCGRTERHEGVVIRSSPYYRHAKSHDEATVTIRDTAGNEYTYEISQDFYNNVGLGQHLIFEK